MYIGMDLHWGLVVGLEASDFYHIRYAGSAYCPGQPRTSLKRVLSPLVHWCSTWVPLSTLFSQGTTIHGNHVVICMAFGATYSKVCTCQVSFSCEQYKRSKRGRCKSAWIYTGRSWWGWKHPISTIFGMRALLTVPDNEVLI